MSATPSEASLDCIVKPFDSRFSPEEWARGKSHFQNTFCLIWPRNRRKGIADFYAFCRLADDLADETSLPKNDRSLALSEIEDWVLTKKITGHIFWDRFLLELRDARVSDDILLGVIRGVRKDLENPAIRFKSWSDLETYLFEVAGCVGLGVLSFFDIRGEQARDYAVHMGNFVQYINIMRDLEEDLSRGKVFLPEEFLIQNRIGLTPSEPADFARCREELLSRAAAARQAAIPFHKACLIPELMGAIYREGALKYWRYGIPQRLSKMEQATAVLQTILQFTFDRTSLSDLSI